MMSELNYIHNAQRALQLGATSGSCVCVCVSLCVCMCVCVPSAVEGLPGLGWCLPALRPAGSGLRALLLAALAEVREDPSPVHAWNSAFSDCGCSM